VTERRDSSAPLLPVRRIGEEAQMSTQHMPHPSLRERAFHELKEMLALAAYLYVALAALLLERTALLHEQGINYTAWGSAAIKALLLAKFMLFGRMMNLGQRYRHKPLIWPTLHMGLMFLILLLVLNTIEELVVGLVRDRPLAESLTHVAGPTWAVAAGNVLIMYLILLPYCAFRCLGTVLGDSALIRLFFVSRDEAAPAHSS
jgi:hypothetical protein